MTDLAALLDELQSKYSVLAIEGWEANQNEFARAVAEHADTLLACLRRCVEADSATSQWRPIESAPRDGTLVFISQRGRRLIARWKGYGWATIPGDWHVDGPSSWMPLPEPPTEPKP